jgi:hypothetical protein
MKDYNRYDFLPQKREALLRWERYLVDCAAAVDAAPDIEHPD